MVGRDNVVREDVLSDCGGVKYCLVINEKLKK